MIVVKCSGMIECWTLLFLFLMDFAKRLAKRGLSLYSFFIFFFYLLLMLVPDTCRVHYENTALLKEISKQTTPLPGIS